jgi:hypothetical protein
MILPHFTLKMYLAAMIFVLTVTAFHQPGPGRVWLSAWLDTADSSPGALDGDRPIKFNQRMGMNFSSFQYAQNLPVNYTNNEFPFPMEQIDELQTNAVLFLTVYPFRSTLPHWNVSGADIEFLSDQIKNLTTRPHNPCKVLLRLGPEMNGNWMEFGMQPTKYIPLWRKVHAAIKSVSPETAFVWSPNFAPGWPFGSQGGRILGGMLDAEDLAALDTNRNGRLDVDDDPYLPFYPGDEYVDYVGLSFYWKGINSLPGPRDYESSINSRNFYQDFAVRRNKPMMVSEGGAVLFPDSPMTPGVTELQIKRAWWNQSITSNQFLDRYPQVKLFSLFEFRKVEDASPFGGAPPLSDFRISHDPEMIRAFVNDFQSVRSRYDLATYVSPPPEPEQPARTVDDKKPRETGGALTMMSYLPFILPVVTFFT